MIPKRNARVLNGRRRTSRKVHLPMKGKRYADVEAIQKACTGMLAAIPGNELKHSFDMLLDREKRCIKAEGDYFK